MRILILVDLMNNWALHNRAKAIKKFLPEHDIDIAAALTDDVWIRDVHKYDVVHFNFNYGLTQYTDLLRALKHKAVITVVNERSLLNAHGVDPQAFEDILKNFPHVTSVSQKIAGMFPNIKYIPNGIDEDLFPKSQKPIVGYAGVADKDNKNVSAIQKACSDLMLELRIAGYSRDHLGKNDLSHDKMYNFYRSIDVYVHASLTEGFNNTVLEALACNTPVLMTRQGCWQEFEGFVDFIEPDFEDIKEKLKKFTGRRLVDEKFLWKNLIPKYGEVYESAFAGKN